MAWQENDKVGLQEGREVSEGRQTRRKVDILTCSHHWWWWRSKEDRVQIEVKVGGKKGGPDGRDLPTTCSFIFLPSLSSREASTLIRTRCRHQRLTCCGRSVRLGLLL